MEPQPLTLVKHNECIVCGNSIELMCRTGTGICCELCQKTFERDLVPRLESVETEGHHASE